VRELGKSIARQIAKLANGNIPYNKSRDQVMKGVGQRKNVNRLLIFFWELESFPGQEFKLFFRLIICHRMVRKMML